jgi:cyclin H
MRATTNARAASRVKAAIRRSRLERDSKEMKEDSVQQNRSEAEVDCLTVEEERKILDYYCTATMQLADTCEFPTNVKVDLRCIS